MTRNFVIAAAIAAVSSIAFAEGAETGKRNEAAAAQGRAVFQFVFGQPYYDKPGRDRPYHAPPYAGR